MLNMKETIENGVMYQIVEGSKFSEKTFKCFEYALNIDANVEETETGVTIDGFIYKTHYTDEVTPINNPVKIGINGEWITELQPENEIVEFSITIDNVKSTDIKSIMAEETNVHHVSIKKKI